jgi:hypothetical protein
MAAGDSNQIEIEVALRDSTSAVLKDISRQIDTVSKKMVETGKTGAEAFDKIKRSAQGSREESSRTNQSLTGMHGIMTGMAKTLLGPTGVAAGFVAVERAMSRFAENRVQLQAMSADVGISTGYISVMERTLARMGVKGSAEVIQNLGGQLKELSTYKFNSQLFTDLNRMGEGDFAKKLLATVESGDYDKAVRMMIDKYTELGEKSKAKQTYYAREVIHTNESILKSYGRTAEGVGQAYEISYTESQEYLNKMESIHNKWNTVMGKTLNTTLSALNQMDTGFSSLAEKIRNFVGLKYFKAAETKPGESVAKEVTNESTRIRMGLPPLIMGPEQPNQQKPPGRATGGPTYSGRNYIVGERGPEVFSPSQSGQIRVASAGQTDINTQEIADTEKDSNKTLHDVLDILKQMDNPIGGDGGGDGGGGSQFRAGPAGGGRGSGGDGSGVGAVPPMGEGAAKAIAGAMKGGGMYNYFQKHGVAPPSQSSMQSVQTPYGKILVNPEAAADFAGFAQDLKAAGAPIKSFGSYSHREKRWGGGWSSHAYGAALDIDDATGLSPAMQKWILANPDQWAAMKKKWNLGQPLSGPLGVGGKDAPHVEWMGPHGSTFEQATNALKSEAGNLKAGDRGAVDPAALHERLKELIEQSGLKGYLPADAKKYGFKTGSAEEWAGLMSGIAGWESGNKAGAIGDSGRSHGLFQLSPQDAVTYGIQKTPFTQEQLADPDFNARMAVIIAEKRAKAGGVGGQGGMADYWAGHGKRTSYLEQGRVQAGKDVDTARRAVDEQSKSASARKGTVTASVDFSELEKAQKITNPFMTLKVPSSRQNKSVREGEVVAGDPGYSQWTP